MAPTCCLCVVFAGIGLLCVAMFCVVRTIPHHARLLLWLEHYVASMWFLHCGSVHWCDGMHGHDSMRGCGDMALCVWCDCGLGPEWWDGLLMHGDSILVLESRCVGMSQCMDPAPVRLASRQTDGASPVKRTQDLPYQGRGNHLLTHISIRGN